MDHPDPTLSFVIRHHVLRLIELDKYRAERKYRGTTKWWNPERAAFYNKTAKRFSQLYARGNKIPQDKKVELGALFCAFAAYKNCVTSTYDESPSYERQCYEKHLSAYLKAE